MSSRPDSRPAHLHLHPAVPRHWPSPKKDCDWQVTYHLSAPHNRSINDFIDPALYSLNYCTIDNAISLLGKIDLKKAFQLCPVLKEDWPLHGAQCALPSHLA